MLQITQSNPIKIICNKKNYRLQYIIYARTECIRAVRVASRRNFHGDDYVRFSRTFSDDFFRDTKPLVAAVEMCLFNCIDTWQRRRVNTNL